MMKDKELRRKILKLFSIRFAESGTRVIHFKERKVRRINKL